LPDEFQTWKGYQVCGFDGTTLQLPDSPGIRVEFNTMAGPDEIPHARACECADVLNKIRVASVIAPVSIGERELFRNLLDKMKRPDRLLLMDRVFAAHWLFQLCLVEEQPFCARLKVSHSSEAKTFLDSGQIEGQIHFSPTAASIELLKEEGVVPVGFSLRAVRVELVSTCNNNR